jgi:uncharacterized membrane protein
MASKKKNSNNPAAHKRTVEPAHQRRNGGQVAVQASYSGPIPQAQELAKYEAIIPGAAERILQMAEKNQAHQISIEIKALDAARREARRGQVFALLIALCAFGAAIAAMIMGYPVVASVIGGTTVVSLAVAFIKGREPAAGT